MENSTSLPAIEIQQLTKRFGSVVAVNDLSFTVQAGELFFLLGPSGCGKSTLLRMLAGLETPDAGTIYFSGEDISSLPPHKRGAPMVFQNYALWPHLTVHDNIAFGLVERGVSKNEISSRVQEALDQVDLEGLGARKPSQLSGGQQQRVALARALVVRPKIVLLDEPLSNLDAKLRLEMRYEIERIHEKTDLTLIYVTHDQSEALGLADRMAVMESGRIRALGTPRDLYHRPPNCFCAKFLGEANLIPGRYLGREGEYGSVATAFGVWKGVLGGRHTIRNKDKGGSEIELEEQAPVRCMVRPENIHLQSSETGQAEKAGEVGSNTFEAESGFVRLNGSTVSVGLRAGELDLHAILLSQAQVNLRSGEKRKWRVDPADIVILPEPSNGDEARTGEGGSE